MAWRRRLTTEQQNQLLIDYARNIPVADIAAKYGVHHSYPALLARRRGRATRSNKENIRYAGQTQEPSSEREHGNPDLT